MPWPGTNIPAPWDPAPTPAPPDTTQRDALIKQLIAQHGGAVGTPSTPLVKNPKDPSGPEIPGPYDLYTFGDGSTIEIAPTGEVSKYSPKDKSGTVTGWTDITQVRNPDQTISFYGKDPKDPGGPLKKVEGLPDSAAPTSAAKPTPSAQLDKLDASGNVIAPGDTTTKPISLRDPSTGTVIDIPKDPAGAIQKIGDTYYVIKPDGSAKPATDANGKPLSEPDKPTSTIVPGVGLVTIDPTKPVGSRATIELSEDKNVKASSLQPRVINGKTYVAIDQPTGGIAWQEAKDEQGNALPTDVTWTSYTNDPRSSVIQLIGSNGETRSIKKEDFHPPSAPGAGTVITPDTTSPFVVTLGDNGQPVFTENKNRVSMSDAQKQLIEQLHLKVQDGSMSEDQAKNLIQSATQAMTAQANVQNAQTNQAQLGVTAASQALQGIQNAAQTGAGLLQNRVTAGTSALNQAISAIAGSKMTSAPAGMGANLTGGLSEWVTQLGGGQPVYDSAAAMVNQANPAVKGDPTVAQQAYTALRGAMDLYKQQTGTDYVPPNQRTGFGAPTTAEWSPSQPPATATTAPMTPSQPVAAPQPAALNMASANQVAGQNYGVSTAFPLGPNPYANMPMQPVPPLPFRAPVTA